MSCLYEFLLVVFLFWWEVFLATLCGLWDLSSPTRGPEMEPLTSAVAQGMWGGAWSKYISSEFASLVLAKIGWIMVDDSGLLRT